MYDFKVDALKWKIFKIDVLKSIVFKNRSPKIDGF